MSLGTAASSTQLLVRSVVCTSLPGVDTSTPWFFYSFVGSEVSSAGIGRLLVKFCHPSSMGVPQKF